MGGRSEPLNLDDLTNLPAEFGKIFHGKLWSLVISVITEGLSEHVYCLSVKRK